MTFDEILEQVRALLQSRGRLAYRALKRRFDLDDEYLDDLKAELIKAEGVAADEDGEVLVWTGKGTEKEARQQGSRAAEKKHPPLTDSRLSARDSRPDAGERRQLTVMFCDLVGSTALSAQLDPEDYRAVVQRYQQTCAEVIRQYEGYLAQYLGDATLSCAGTMV